jgi:hypothetical protein
MRVFPKLLAQPHRIDRLIISKIIYLKKELQNVSVTLISIFLKLKSKFSLKNLQFLY